MAMSFTGYTNCQTDGRFISYNVNMVVVIFRGKNKVPNFSPHWFRLTFHLPVNFVFQKYPPFVIDMIMLVIGMSGA